MFIVELQGSKLITTDSPEEATKKYRESLEKLDEDTSYYDVFNTSSTERFVIAHNVDDGPPEFERIEHFTREERVKLVEELMFKAHCCDDTLRQICEMAAMQINTRDAYNDWCPDQPEELEENNEDAGSNSDPAAR